MRPEEGSRNGQAKTAKQEATFHPQMVSRAPLVEAIEFLHVVRTALA